MKTKKKTKSRKPKSRGVADTSGNHDNSPPPQSDRQETGAEEDSRLSHSHHGGGSCQSGRDRTRSSNNCHKRQGVSGSRPGTSASNHGNSEPNAGCSVKLGNREASKDSSRNGCKRHPGTSPHKSKIDMSQVKPESASRAQNPHITSTSGCRHRAGVSSGKDVVQHRRNKPRPDADRNTSCTSLPDQAMFLQSVALDLVREQAAGSSGQETKTRPQSRQITIRSPGSKGRLGQQSGGRNKSTSQDRSAEGRRRPAAASATVTSGDPSVGDSPQDDGDVPDIPGFYYDREKKNYFRILPNHQSHANVGVVTKDTIKFAESERKRKHDLSGCHRNQTTLTLLHGRKNCVQSLNLCSSLLNRQTSPCPQHIQRCITLSKLRQLAPRAQEQLHVDNEHLFNRVEDCRMFLLGSDSKRFLGVWSLKDTFTERLQRGCFHPVDTRDENGRYNLQRYRPDVALFPTGRVTGLCWAPNSQSEHDFLYTSTCFIGNNKPSIVYLRDDRLKEKADFNLGKRALWCCAWNRPGAQFSVGTDRSSLVLDTVTRRMWEVTSRGSTVFTQVFSQQASSVLYAGTRRGDVLCQDMRCPLTAPTLALRHHLTVSHLYLGQDDRQLVVSDVGGKLRRWDLRQRRVVLDYPGHVCSYKRQPFHVDIHEDVLAAGGEDCYSRLWDYRTGELLVTLPPPHPAHDGNIPCLGYSPGLGGRGGVPGLLLATRAEFHFYTF